MIVCVSTVSYDRAALIAVVRDAVHNDTSVSIRQHVCRLLLPTSALFSRKEGDDDSTQHGVQSLKFPSAVRPRFLKRQAA